MIFVFEIVYPVTLAMYSQMARRLIPVSINTTIFTQKGSIFKCGTVQTDSYLPWSSPPSDYRRLKFPGHVHIITNLDVLISRVDVQRRPSSIPVLSRRQVLRVMVRCI